MRMLPAAPFNPRQDDMTRPNIIVILADDMGYGDMRCNDPDCRIPTPHLDRLAQRGMRFTDAHAGTAVCTPSRYALLTGRYCWRSRLKQGIVWDYDGSLIEEGRPTVASLLHEQGYATHCIGKWHLGMDWPTHDGRHPNETLPFADRSKGTPSRDTFGSTQINYQVRIAGGPVDRGFDSYFGVDVPNFPPYTWFVDDHVDPLPTERKAADIYGSDGPAAPGWTAEAMIPSFTQHAIQRIDEAAKTPDRPLFLYFPLTSPHSPIVPNEPYHGQSGIGPYGDFVCELDDVVGRIISALERNGQLENTLVIFTSDNGPEHRTGDDEGVYERGRRTGHYSMGPLRGIKRDAWEGGHRVPFVAAWPGTIPGGSVCEQSISLVDVMATCAQIIDRPLPAGAGEDSVSFWPLLAGRVDAPTRDHVIHQSVRGKFVIRQGDWVLIDAAAGNDSPEPEWFTQRIKAVPHEQPGELYNLRDDPRQTTNLYAEQPQRVEAMRKRLAAIQAGDVFNV
jgi:arylsulfatase A